MLQKENFTKVQEIFEQNLSGHLDEKETVESIQSLKQYREHLPEMINLIVLNFYHQQKQKYEESQLEVFFNNLRDFLDELIDQKIIREKDLIKYLNEQILSSTEILDEKVFKKKILQIYTLLNFKQHKFNLICENTQGFASFIAKILSFDTQSKPEEIFNQLQEIVGFYNLDPNKIIEIIIDILRTNSNLINLNFQIEDLSLIDGLLRILRKTNPDNIKKIIVQRLNNLDSKHKPYSLLNIIAFLCKHDFIEVEIIWNNLFPKEDDIIGDLSNKNESAINLFKEAFMVTIFKSEEDSKIKLNKIEKLQQNLMSSYNKNHKLEFLHSLLNVDNFSDFEKIFKKIDEKLYFRKVEFFLEAILKILEKQLDNFLLKKQISPNHQKSFRQYQMFDDNQNVIEDNLKLYLAQMLKLFEYISTNISHDQQTFLKLMNFLKCLLKINQQFVKDFLTKFIIPSLFIKTIKEENKQLFLKEVDEIMQNFNYLERFKIYQNIQKDYLYENPYIVNPFVVNETKNFLATICSGQSKEIQNQEKMKTLIETNPFFVGSLLIKEIQKYKSLTKTLVKSFKNTNTVIKEIILWVILNELQNSQLQSGDRIDVKFQLLYCFLAKFIRQNYELENKSVCIFLLNKICITDGNEFLYFLVFKQILEEVLGYSIVNDVNNDQLMGSLGGINLRVNIFLFDRSFLKARNSREQFMKNLLTSKSLLNDKISFNYFWIFYFHLCKVTIRIIYQATMFSIKTNNTLVDQIQETKQLMIDLLQLNKDLKIEFSQEQLNYILENEMRLLPQDVLKIVSLIFRNQNPEISEENFEKFYELINKNKTNIFQGEQFLFENLFEDQKIDNFEIDKNMILLWYLQCDDIFLPLDNYNYAIDKINRNLSSSNVQTFKNGEGFKSLQEYIDFQELLKKNLEEEKNQLELRIKQNEAFVQKYFFQEISNTHSILNQGILLRLNESTKEVFFSFQYFQMSQIKNSKNATELFKNSFRIIFKMIPCLNGFTENESMRFGQFFNFMFEVNQYVNETSFKKELEKHIQKFNKIKKDFPINEKEIKKLLQTKIQKLIQTILKDFEKSSPIFAKNILTFLKISMNIFPKSLKNIESLLQMFEANQDFITLYPDLKLSCQNYQKNLLQMKKKFDIKQNQNQLINSPQPSKVSTTKRSQISGQNRRNSPPLSTTQTKKSNVTSRSNRNQNFNRQQNYNRNNGQRRNRDNRNYRDRKDRDNYYYKKKYQTNQVDQNYSKLN